MPADGALIKPDWPTPPGIQAFTTTRAGGCSAAPFDSFNLGDHVGDADQAVQANRTRLAGMVPGAGVLPWLTQVHGVEAVQAACALDVPQADASWTCERGVACVVLTADCLPVLICSRSGSYVAAIHAGWRGLCAGIIEATLSAAPVDCGELQAWLGPAIGPAAFEVGEEVREAFLSAASGAGRPAIDACFCPAPDRPGHYFADLYALGRQRLAEAGVIRVYGGHWCTFSDSSRFFSYRRDGQTGRMASLILRS